MALERRTQDPVVYESESFLKGAAKRFVKHKLAMFGLVIIVTFSTAVFLSNQIGTHSITRQNLRNRFAPATSEVIAVTGISLSGSTSLTGVLNGQVFATDMSINIPLWYQSISERTSLPPVTDGNQAYLATDSGVVVAYRLQSGSEVWKTEVGGSLTGIFSFDQGVMVLDGPSTVRSIGDDGALLWSTDVGETINSKVFGHFPIALALTENGHLYSFDEHGRRHLEYRFESESPQVGAVDGTTAYIYSNSRLLVYDLANGSGLLIENLPGIDRTPRTMLAYPDHVVVGFEQGFIFSYNVPEQKTVWQTHLESDILESVYDGRRSIHAVSLDGRLLVLNPRTGGITSSRMVQGYSDRHILGTDELGRDVFSRLLAGGRVSMSLGFTVALISVTVGSIVGALAGFFGGVLDNLLMRFVDFMMAIPALPLLMIISYLLGPSYQTMIVVLVLFGWIGISRIVRSQTLSLKQQEFILASRAIGLSTPRIIFRHILPNTIGPIIVAATLSVGSAILSESQLSYLGLGIQPPTPSWGNMLMLARNYLSDAPWLAVWPGLLIFLTLLSINFIGDGLRDALDPKLKGRD